jgi:hypothetical protein
MKLKFKLVIIFSLLFCFSVEGQQDTTNYIYQRTYKRLKDKGLVDSEIKKYIKESDSLQTVFFNQEMQRIENEYLANNPPQPLSSTCSDIPVQERAVLLAIYNNLNGPVWANGWDFNVPITTWSQSSGVAFTPDCHVKSITIQNNSLTGPLPDLSNLTYLTQLKLVNNSNSIFGNSSSFAINSSSAFYSIGNLSNLEYLLIQSADFNGSLPVNFINLAQKIKSFLLTDCNLNNVSQLSNIIGAYTKLENLCLTKNFIGPNSYDFALPQSFNNLINLKTIQIINSRINDFSSITNLSNLSQIQFIENSISGNLPNMSNLTSLKVFMVSDNLITGNIPSYFQSFSFNSFRISNNYINGTIPPLNITGSYNDLQIFYNKFRFNDFVNDFNTYNNSSNISGFGYSPQAKTDNIETINAGAGQPITLTMCQDGNFHPNDSYKWYRNGSPISGAESREYTFTASTASAGVYHCRSQHFNPPMTNNSTNVNKNLTLYRNDITVNVVNAPPPCVDCTSFDLLLGKKYIITGWVNAMKDNGSDYEKLNVFDYDKAKIAVTFLAVGGSVIGSPLIFNTSGEIIDGWQKISGEFIVPNNIDDIKIELVNDYSNSISTFFDDIRVHPVEGNMKSFVYNQETQKLMAELDENNYATFYEYDKEGGLVRVKKETEKGVNTIQETRSSTKKTGN